MSSVRGGRGTSRGRAGSMLAQNSDGARQPRPGFQTRGRGQTAFARGGATRGSPVRGATRGRGGAAARGGRPATPQPLGPATGEPPQRFQLLKQRRENERKEAIRHGFLADPDKPRTLAEAITPVGTCPDMCAEFERLERIVQKDVWAQETREDGSADEARMVKKFRRAAAGIDEQLPSDLRPPQTLKKTCDYLFDTLIGGAESLGTVHHFVWDRTRAIRNDFSIQQITKPGDVEIAIECYERIARFHMLSLHQFAVPEKPYDKYDWYQEREQLDRTLLSLMQYYDDNRDRVNLKNEAEFRAYCIIFQIQDPIPDLEDRVSCFPQDIKNHPRVRIALDLYSAACNILDPQGPLKPREPHPVAREDWNGFFKTVESNQVSYLMACVSEIYFNMVRKQTLNAIWKSFKRQGSTAVITDFSLDYLTDLLRFDDFDQTRNFCEHYSFGFKDLPDQSDEYLDLNSVQGKSFPEATAGLSVQIFSQSVVENKRMGRTFSSVISGKNYATAKNEGQIVEEESMGYDRDMQMDDDGDSLFVPMDGPPKVNEAQTAPENPISGFSAFSTNGNTASNPFQAATAPTSTVFQSSTTGSNPFAKPPPSTNNAAGSSTPAGSPFAQKPGLQDSIFAKPPTASSPFSTWSKPSSSPWSKPVAPSDDPAQSNSKNASIFGQPTQGTLNTEQQPQQQTPKTTQSTMTSMHAPGTFSWSKPSPSPWSTPVSTAPTTSAAASTTPTATPTAPTISSESVFPKPASQPNFPSFSFAKPAAPEQTRKESPKFHFANQSGDHQKQAETDKPKTSFSFPSAPSPTTNSQPAAQETNSTTTTSVFNFAPSSNDKTTVSSEPAFSFPSSQTASSETKQESQPQKPLFSFTSQPAPPPSGTPTNASGLSQEPAKDSVFSTRKTTSAEPSKPFSFISASPSQQQKQQPAQSTPPSQPAQAQQQPQPSLQRSPSFSQPNQPKKRSPLSQSFTAEEEQPKSSPSTAFNFDTPPRQPPVASSTPQSTFKAPVAPSQPPNQPSPAVPQKSVDPQAILTKLATEIVTDQERGLLRQFIEYHARPIIMSVYEELYAEEMRELADKFRKEKLAKRYGRRWRETSWRLRLARQGKEKREKRRTARRDRATAEENKRRRVETNAVDDFLKRQSVRVHQASVNGGSPAASFATTSRRSSVTSQSTVQTEPATNNNYRDSPREKARDTAPANRVDSHGRIVKPSTPASSIDSSARKSHFLGFSVPKQRSIMGGSTPRQQSAYFRMKALGINPSASGVAAPMGPPPLNLKKRAREDDESDLAEATPPPKKSRTPPQQTTTQSRMRSSSNFSQSSVLDLSPGRSTVGSVAMSRMDLEDNDILARARAARQAFRDSTRSHRSEARQQDNMSVVSQEEPSVKTKMQARLRAVNRAEQNLAQSVSTREVPAYRMRESRFVPREQYGRAVERAKENLERRSRAGSIASARDDGLRPEAVEVISKPASVMSVNDDAPTPVASNAASMGHHGLRPEHAREVSRPASAMSVHDDAPTHLATQPVSMDVEMSQTQTKSRSPSIRPASRGTQQDDSFSYQQSQPQQSQSFGFDHDSQPHIAQQHQPFGFDHQHQPRDTGFAPVHGWSFQALDSGATMPPQDTQLGQTPGDAFVAAAEPSQQPLASNFGDMDTQTISASSYLSLGNDIQTNGPEQFSTYPDIHENQVPGGMDVHQEDVPFVQDTEIVQDHRFLNDAAQQALGLDSSLNLFQQQHESQEDQQPGFLHQEMEEDSTYHQEASVQQEREESQIDPSLLDSTPDVPIAGNAEVREEVIPAPQPDKKPDMAQVRSASSLVSKNPFAALASASSEQGDSSSVSDSSLLDEDEDGEDEDEGEATEREDHDSSILRQIDDDTFIPNGIIQDVLPRDGQTASDLQDAQRDVDPGTSFSSVAAPADLDAAPAAPSPINRPVSDREASTPAEELAPMTQSKRQRPTPPALEVYQPPRTRSKSRDLSAPPTPTVTTRAAAREGSQRPPSRNGFLSPSPGDAALSSSPARRKSGSAQVEEHLPAVKEVEEEVVEGEGEGEEETKEGDGDGDDEVDDERADGNASDVEEDDRDQSGQELARRALEGVEDEDEEMGEVEVEEEDEEGEGMGEVAQAEDGDDEELEVEEDEEEEPGDGDEEPVDARNGNANGEDQEGYDEEGEEFDEDEEEYDEEEDEYDEEEEEGEDFPYQRSASRALTPGQMQESGLIKGGTGQEDDAFELSD